LFKFREVGIQVSPVTISCPFLRTSAPPCLPLDIKDSLKEDRRLLFLLWDFALRLFALELFALGFCFETFVLGYWAFDFLIWEAFGGEQDCRREKDCGRENELLKGKCWRKIAEGGK
jgi:hypothetical protein